MAARGAAEKEYITQKILETFEGSFAIDKEIRIPLISDGAEIQIKCVLTAASKNVENPNGGTAAVQVDAATAGSATSASNFGGATQRVAEPSKEEKDKIDDFMKKMGLI